MKKIIILIIVGIIMFSTIIFAGDNDDEYATHSANPQIQTEFSK
ncbi:hypothetical protein Marpi_1507 [Marinitoga piezophila KA3]|uniref:Uncharacterized protein n=1 Tax=Marinitoga piezophila (strain DSM 14283 / JCM 11233 / KA3) TaxID=443254 RepID=H2J487_MARPK|nr:MULTISPECIES: hypothetical protein [Marinitoga]AEX85902.1 hypothetical protein Marpi_1507 [Marinitoga piezophila KA3]